MVKFKDLITNLQGPSWRGYQPKYALFKDDKQVSKTHSTIQAVTIEAYELGAMLSYGADFIGDTSGVDMAAGYMIKEL